MIIIKEVRTKRELTDFIKFSFSIYKDNSYWVPPIISDELKFFNKETNPIFKEAEAYYYLAYRNGEIVGKIAAIINWLEVKEQKKAKVRFGWFDVIDDIKVTEALLNKVVELGKSHNLSYIEGPVGFSNMDKAGMLVEGFDEVATMIGIYNHSYYPVHLEKLGFTTESEWLEFKINLSDVTIEKTFPISELIEKRYGLRAINFKSTQEILPYVDEMFRLLNVTYADLQSFVPIQQFQIDIYKEKYISYIHPDFITCVLDNEDKMIAFAITMPSFSKAFQKAKGKLFPFGFLHLLKAMKKNNHVELYLIGVDPEYQRKGVTSIIFRDFKKAYTKHGIETMETNPLLIENNKIINQWKTFNPRTHKRRKTFRKEI